MTLCECGCGRSSSPGKRFIRGHAVKGRSLRREGGGLSFDRESGRWRISCRGGGYVYFYRAVMEAQLGRELRPDEEVHHVNEDPGDDRPENLELLTPTAHRHRHRATRDGRCRRGHSLADAYEVPATGILQCAQCREIRRERERAKR